MTIYQTIYLSIVTYGAENWVLTDRQEKRLQATLKKEGVMTLDKN